MQERFGRYVSDEDADRLDKLEKERDYYDKMQYVMKIRNNS